MNSNAKVLRLVSVGILMVMGTVFNIKGQVSENDSPTIIQGSQAISSSTPSEVGYTLVIESKLENYKRDLERFEKLLDSLDNKIEKLRDKCDKNAEWVEVLNQLEKNLRCYKEQFEKQKEPINKTDDYDKELKWLKDEIREYDKRVNDISRQLNEGMVARMRLQQGWFMFWLTVMIVLNAGGAITAYWTLQKRVVDKSLEEFKRNARTTIEAAYKGAMGAVAMCDAVIKIAEQLPKTPPMVKILRELTKLRAQLQVSFGDSEEVIAGADILSQIGERIKDIQILRDSSKREELSDEAKETLERAIRDLEKKAKDKS